MRPKFSLIVSLVFVFFIYPVAAKADPMLWSSSFVDFNTLDNEGNPGTPLIICDVIDDSCIGSVTVPGTEMTMSGGAYGASSYGNLQAYGAASISGSGGTPDYEYAVVRGRAAYREVMTVWGQSRDEGSSGSMSLSFTVTGNASESPGNFSGFGFNLRIFLPGGGYTDNPFGDLKTDGVVTSPEIPFVFGQPFEYAIWFTAGINILDFSDGSYAISDFYHTATLTGINVFDSKGRIIRNFSIQAESGTIYGANGIVPNYTKPFKGWVQAIGNPDYSIDPLDYPYLAEVIQQRGLPIFAQIQRYQGVNNVGGASIHENAQMFYLGSVPGTVEIYEASTITVANADQIFVEIAGVVNIVTGEIVTITETVAGGTGRFEGSEGSIVIKQGMNMNGDPIFIYDGGYITTVGEAKKQQPRAY